MERILGAPHHQQVRRIGRRMLSVVRPVRSGTEVAPMGLFKAWKEVKAVAASGTSTGPRPHGAQRPHGGVALGFAMAMMKMMGPLLAAEAPERGDPLPGTEAGVLGPQDPGAMQAAIAAITA